MTTLTLNSTSRATDAGWLAIADIASITTGLDVSYRLIGGLAITLIVHAHGATELAPERETSDADLGVPFDVCSDERLLPTLLKAGYTQAKGNRFIRTAGGRELVIDILAPSYVGKLVSNQKHGALVVDEVPGLLTALLEPPTTVDVAAVLTDGTLIEARLLLPDVCAGLVMKAHTYRGRLKASDATDIHRLLEAAYVAGRTASDWPQRADASDAAQILHETFAGPRPNRFLDNGVAARVRLLVHRIVPTV